MWDYHDNPHFLVGRIHCAIPVTMELGIFENLKNAFGSSKNPKNNLTSTLYKYLEVSKKLVKKTYVHPPWPRRLRLMCCNRNWEGCNPSSDARKVRQRLLFRPTLGRPLHRVLRSDKHRQLTVFIKCLCQGPLCLRAIDLALGLHRT